MNFLRKGLTILTITVSVISFSSCSDDDGDSSPAASPAQRIASSTLVGNWEMTSLDYAGTSSNTVAGQTITTEFTGVGKDFTYTLTFSDNPKEFVSTGGYTVELTSIFAGQSTTQDVPIPNAGTTGTWELNGNTLVLVDNNTNETSTTEILSGSNNSFSYDFAGVFGRSVQGANVALSSGQVSFERIP